MRVEEFEESLCEDCGWVRYWSIPNCFQAPNDLLTDVGMVKKGFGNEPLKDVTIERMRVEEFEESLCEDYGWVNLVFL